MNQDVVVLPNGNVYAFSNASQSFTPVTVDQGETEYTTPKLDNTDFTLLNHAQFINGKAILVMSAKDVYVDEPRVGEYAYLYNSNSSQNITGIIRQVVNRQLEQYALFTVVVDTNMPDAVFEAYTTLVIVTAPGEFVLTRESISVPAAKTTKNWMVNVAIQGSTANIRNGMPLFVASGVGLDGVVNKTSPGSIRMSLAQQNTAMLIPAESLIVVRAFKDDIKEDFNEFADFVDRSKSEESSQKQIEGVNMIFSIMCFTNNVVVPFKTCR